jgi:hypothetical protein
LLISGSVLACDMGGECKNNGRPEQRTESVHGARVLP